MGFAGEIVGMLQSETDSDAEEAVASRGEAAIVVTAAPAEAHSGG